MRALPRRIGGTAALAVACVLAACASAPHPHSPFAPLGTVLVVVENHGWEDVSVYASTGTDRRRLGHVTSGRSESFRPLALASPSFFLELVARPLGNSPLHRSGRILVHAGQKVTWTIHQSRLGGDITIR